jgi:hypothetical protein
MRSVTARIPSRRRALAYHHRPPKQLVFIIRVMLVCAETEAYPGSYSTPVTATVS